MRSCEPYAAGAPEIRLPSGASTCTRPGTGVIPSLNVTVISVGELPMMLPGAGSDATSAACAPAGAAASRPPRPVTIMMSTRGSQRRAARRPPAGPGPPPRPAPFPNGVWRPRPDKGKREGARAAAKGGRSVARGRSAAPRPARPLSQRVVRLTGPKGSSETDAVPRAPGDDTIRAGRVAPSGAVRATRRPSMSVHPRAGTPADSRDTIDVPRVVLSYYTEHPDPQVAEQRVAFGTSGHRGSSLRTAFNEDHIAATSQAIVEYRRDQGTDGPLFLGRDTHALSDPAMITALEVFAANDVTVLIDSRDGYTPTPAVSHAILTYNRARGTGLADGVVVTPSHNPPDDGGFKYNPPNGGPADTDATRWIQDRANELIAGGLKDVQRVPAGRARASSLVSGYDFLAGYVDDLPSVIDMDAIRESGVRIGADPLGGASVAYWGEIASRHRLDLTVVNPD